MILITTSRKPSRRTRRFCKELSWVLPFSKYVNRGKGNVSTVVDRARAEGYRTVFIVGETKGNPSIIRVLRITGDAWEWKYQVYIRGVSLTLDTGRPAPRIDADDVVVDGENYADVLSDMLSDYDGEDGVVVRERDGRVVFLYDGKVVGPWFTITGRDEIPRGVVEQSK